MKNFKTLLSEKFDLESETEDIKPSSENDHGSYITRKYISKINDDEIEFLINFLPTGIKFEYTYLALKKDKF